MLPTPREQLRLKIPIDKKRALYKMLIDRGWSLQHFWDTVCNRELLADPRGARYWAEEIAVEQAKQIAAEATHAGKNGSDVGT